MGDVRGRGCQSVNRASQFRTTFVKQKKNSSGQMLLPYAYVANKSTQSDYKQLRLILRPLTI